MSPAERHLDDFLELSETHDVSLGFLLPFLYDKDEDIVLDALKHLKRYAEKIPPCSTVGKDIRMRRKGFYPPAYASR